MKTRISLTVDPKVTHRAKRVAQARQQSLSSMVEAFLRDVAEETEPSAVSERSFSERWGGKLKIQSKDETRFELLAKKYNL